MKKKSPPRKKVSPPQKKSAINNRTRGTSKRKKRDRLTPFLLVIALSLLILVILSFNQNFLSAVFPNMAPDSGTSPPPQVKMEQPPEKTPPPLPETLLETPPEEPIMEESVTDISGPELLPDGEETKLRIFLVKIDKDRGQITLKGVLRTVHRSSIPLTQALRSLLNGPQSAELSKGYLSLIPEKVKLLGVHVEDEIAWIDFNETFRFNALGIEGYSAQVEQVVYTATEFLTVSKVQILIEGQKLDYLGAEGFWIGGPLGREDF